MLPNQGIVLAAPSAPLGAGGDGPVYGGVLNARVSRDPIDWDPKFEGRDTPGRWEKPVGSFMNAPSHRNYQQLGDPRPDELAVFHAKELGVYWQ